MSEGVTVTVTWTIKPDRREQFEKSLRGMFPESRLHPGFRSIRLLQSATDPNDYVLIEEWDMVQNFHAYAKFREGTGDTQALLSMTVSYPQVGIWSHPPLAEAAKV